MCKIRGEREAGTNSLGYCTVIRLPGSRLNMRVRGPISNFSCLVASSWGGVSPREPRLATAPTGVEGGAGLDGGTLLTLRRASLGPGADPGVPSPSLAGGIA